MPLSGGAFSIWLAVIMIVSDGNGGVKACPKLCNCIWKSGKQTLECISKQLLDIPDGIDSNTQVLHFSGNRLYHIDDFIFERKRVIHLQKMFLSDCQIRDINNRSFAELKNLVELDLSGNHLKHVPSQIFPDIPLLMRLNLNHNPIERVPGLAFAHLVQLHTLEMKRCKITHVELDAFDELQYLEWLHLEGNQLKRFDAVALPKPLKGLDISSNRFECDCNLKELYAWLNRSPNAIVREPLCYGPKRVANRAIRALSIHELACLPEISPTSFYLELAEGRNASLVCHVRAIPEAAVSWSFEGRHLLQNNSLIAPGVRLLYFAEDGREIKRSELFIQNVDPVDNGTYLCVATNAAGSASSNFTIKIILKEEDEEPAVVMASIPFEYYVVGLIVGFAVVGVTVLVIVTTIILRYRQRAADEEVGHNKSVVTTHYNESPSLIMDSGSSPNASGEKIVLCKPSTDELLKVFYSTSSEPNPDIITGTNSAAATVFYTNFQQCFVETQNPTTASQCHYRTDVVVDQFANTFISPNALQVNYYKTLPSKRKATQVSVSNFRYPYEAEYSMMKASALHYYDHYHTNIRYTVDGYPTKQPIDHVVATNEIPTTMWKCPNGHNDYNATSQLPEDSTTSNSTIVDPMNAATAMH